MAAINAYLSDLMANPNHRYTASELTIHAPLCQHFTALLTLSDQDVREYGCSLDWVAPGNLTAALQRFDGHVNGTAVDLQTLAERQRATYIGGFHTHPYAAKYGAGVGIGPSNGDWMEWWNRPPTGQSVAAQFVASGGELFLLVFRTIPVGALGQNNVTSDTQRLNDAVRTWSDRDQVAYGEALGRRDWAATRTLLTRNSPGVIAHHKADAHQMNCDLAYANGVEYFKGPLNNGPSTLTLASNRVLGNYLTSTFWTHNTDSWWG